jgi:hypothetical protein
MPVSQSEEAVTPYSLLFSGDYGPTLGQIHEGLKQAQDIDLFYGMGITAALGHAYLAAFGEEDLRPRGLLGLVLPALGSEIERRVHDAKNLNYERAFPEWCQAMNAGSPSLYEVPGEWWAATQLMLTEALAHLENRRDAEEARESLHMVNNAINAMLRQHGHNVPHDEPGTYQA